MAEKTQAYKTSLEQELREILHFWEENAIDEEFGGFMGKRDFFNKKVEKAPKGIILNTRLLWSFSAAGNHYKNDRYKELATRAYRYLRENFRDTKNGGVFWELDHTGKPINTRKQIYAQAFAIYALSEYYEYCKEAQALEWAEELFQLIEEKALDPDQNGYYEAFQHDWSPIKDMRLSEKDDNSSKTMNTHLHILEAYGNLFRVKGGEKEKKALENLVDLFLNRFLYDNIWHFQLFFDDNWKRANNLISYGHDIEAVWLILEAARAVKNEQLIQKAASTTIEVARTFLKEAYIKNAGVINEKDLDSGKTDTDRHWWPQVEAMLGLEYAFELTGEDIFRKAERDIWKYTLKHIKDRKHGEWHFRVDENNHPYTSEDKVSMWKAPYHTSRALIKLLKNHTYEK
ncbi:N-acylglucosamine 2-epimerase [Christiangramia fulva]|uniref:Cellobiose 2-epimerase n=1 Tax=Christiangramia fulva TaxID=2126553 RepID=A0A2R3ZAN0_9FLAO|nr:N-acylglucosamine 2-epimerase [Christiangramia fulva]